MNFIYSVHLFCIVCTFITPTRSTSCDFHIGGLVSNRVALNNHVMWTAKAFDVKDCAKICVKRKLCQSFNFDTSTRICELNDDKSNITEKFRRGNNLLYSEISVWPSQIDPDCYNRPCNDDEECIPGFLAGSQTGCSYSCLKLATSATPVQTTPTPPATTTTPQITTTIQLTTTTSQQTTTTAAPTTTTTVAPTTTTTAAPTTTTTAAPTTTISVRGLRLVDGITPNEGRLEILHELDSSWRSVELQDGVWNWEVTQVVCKQLGYNFGGSYHQRDKPFPRGTNKSYKFNNLDCNGAEDSIFDCTSSDIEAKNGNDKDIGVTCFEEDVNKHGFQNLKLVDGANDESIIGYIKILYNGTWTRHCHSLEDKAPDVFCKTISNGAWTKKSVDKTDENWTDALTWTKKIKCFDENTPHPFFCRNEGWRLQMCDQYGTAECQ